MLIALIKKISIKYYINLQSLKLKIFFNFYKFDCFDLSGHSKTSGSVGGVNFEKKILSGPWVK